MTFIAGVNADQQIYFCSRGGGGGELVQKMHNPARKLPRNPTLIGTKFLNPYPYWHKIWAKIGTLTGTKPAKLEYYIILCNLWCVVLKVLPYNLE